MHIHEFGALDNSCTAAGSHYDPLHSRVHGGRFGYKRHIGDLGNVVANEEGKVLADFIQFDLPLKGINSIVGRSVVLHANKDDLGCGSAPDSKTTGNSGGRIACGIIGWLTI
jgi:Cu-Zn family superoxide dismutase